MESVRAMACVEEHELQSKMLPRMFGRSGRRRASGGTATCFTWTCIFLAARLLSGYVRSLRSQDRPPTWRVAARRAHSG
jgi:hypothetical protein